MNNTALNARTCTFPDYVARDSLRILDFLPDDYVIDIPVPRVSQDTVCNELHGPSMFAVKAKIYGVLYNQASSVAFDETSSYFGLR